MNNAPFQPCWLVAPAGLSLVLMMGLAIDPRRPPAADRVLLDWLGSSLPAWLDSLLLWVYRLSGTAFTGMLVVSALLFLLLRRWWLDLGLLMLSTGGILFLIDRVFKPLFDRSRPPEGLLPVVGRSFPSGHAAGSVVFYFAMVTILSAHHPRLRRPLAVGATAWIVLVWLSTLVARVHWPSDLIAGGALGAAWLSVCLAGWDRFRSGSSHGLHPLLP